MSTKVAVVLVAQLALTACATLGADQNPGQLAPGETRSIFNQGAVDRLRNMFGPSAADETPGAAREPSPAPQRRTTRTASRGYGRAATLQRPRAASRRTPPAVEELAPQETTSAETTAAADSEAEAETTTESAAEEPSENTVAQPATTPVTPTTTLAIPRQEATLTPDVQVGTVAATGYQPIIRPAARPVTPKEVAQLPSPQEPAFEIPRSPASRLLAAEEQTLEKPFDVGLSPSPRLIPEQPETAEAAPQPPQPAPQAIAVKPVPQTVAATPVPQAVEAPAPQAIAVQEPAPRMQTTTVVPQRPIPTAAPRQVVNQPVIRPAVAPVPPPAFEPAVPPATTIATQPAPVAPPVVIDEQPAPSDFVAQPAIIGGGGTLRRVERPRPAPPAVARLSSSMVGPKEIYLGDTGIFKVRLINEGDAPAKDVRVEVRADDALMKTLNVGTIPAKTDVEVEIALSPNNAGSLDLRAIATGGEGVKAVAGSVVFVGKPELSLAIAGPPSMNFGDLKMYTAILNNSGNCDATNVTVLVMLQGEQAQTLPVGIVPAGQTRQVRFELRPEQAGQLSVNAVATGDGSVQAVANGAINVVQHEVQLVFEGPRQMRYGEKGIFTLVLSNRGNADAENLVVNVTLGESVLDRLYEGTLAAGKEEKISFEVSPSKPGFHALRAVALGAGDLKATTTAKLQVQHGQLELTVESPTVKFAGAEGAYKVRVKNIGDANAEDVLVTAHLPETVKYMSGVDRIDFYEGITWRIGQMTPGQEETYEIKCELAAAGEQKIVFNATGADQLETSQTVTTAVEALADVRLFVADPQGLVPVGQDIIYEIEVHNRGVKPARNIEVVMQVSPLLEPTHVEGAGAQMQARGVVFDTIPELAAKETVKLRITARAKEKGSHQYRVEMTAEEPSTFMASEGTTRFYGTSAIEAATTSGDE